MCVYQCYQEFPFAYLLISYNHRARFANIFLLHVQIKIMTLKKYFEKALKRLENLILEKLIKVS